MEIFNIGDIVIRISHSNNSKIIIGRAYEIIGIDGDFLELNDTKGKIAGGWDYYSFRRATSIEIDKFNKERETVRVGDIVVRTMYPTRSIPLGFMQVVEEVVESNIRLKGDYTNGRSLSFYRRATPHETESYKKGSRIVDLDQKEENIVNNKNQEQNVKGNIIEVGRTVVTITGGKRPTGNIITGRGRRVAVEVGHLSYKTVLG